MPPSKFNYEGLLHDDAHLALNQNPGEQINPQAKVCLYALQLHPKTWAIARSDRFTLEPEGKDAGNIKLGSSLSACIWFHQGNGNAGTATFGLN